MGKPSDDIELMQHADGELDERAAASVRSRVDKDADARTKLEALGQMSELVRSHLELASDHVPDRKFEGMWRTIAREVAMPTSEVPVVRKPGAWGRVTRWFDRHRGHVITGAVSAGAVAAIALILKPASHDGPTIVQGAQTIEVQPAALRAPTVVDSLDTPGGTGTVLNLEDEDGHTTVIWVSPADTVEGI